MNNNRYTVIHFDCGGYYTENEDGESLRWIPKKAQIFAVLIKTPMEEVTFSGLVDRICKKIGIDKATTKLKLSYIPPTIVPNRLAYVSDDDDVLAFLSDVNKDHLRSLLHVEIIEEVGQNQYSEHVQDLEELSSNRVIDFIDTFNGEAEPFEDLGNIDITYGENNSCQKIDVDASEAIEVAQEDAWEDGIDMFIGQEFGSKQAVQDVVDRASIQKCFEVATIKSSSGLYVVKCNKFKAGCKWSLRVAKLKGSESFSVRTYNKMHTCARVTTSTKRSRRQCSPRLVASLLQENYPGQSDIPNPKGIIELVQEKLGVRVSYATAFRGKRKAVDDLRNSQEKSHVHAPIKNQTE